MRHILTGRPFSNMCQDRGSSISLVYDSLGDGPITDELRATIEGAVKTARDAWHGQSPPLRQPVCA